MIRDIPLRIRPAIILGAVFALVSALAVGLSPTARAATCTNGYVGLTYDDGPTPGNTQNLLAALQQNGLRATFFDIGQNAQANPSLVTAVKNANMWIGNHSWTHPHLIQLSQAQIQSELSMTQNTLTQITGTAPKLFRPPFGETNATLKSVEASLGLTEIIWDVDSQDWNGASTAQIVQRAGGLTNGQIILMHDWPANTVAAVPQIASMLASRNVCPGMISPTTGRAVAPDGTPTDTQAPSAPANLAASGTTQTSTNLSWTASTDNVAVTGYDILRATGATGGTFTQVGTSTTTSFTSTGLTANTVYRFQVRARDAAGNVSAVSNTAQITTQGGGTGDTQAPTTPSGLAASGTTQTGTSLAWTASTDNVGVTGYDVLQAQGATGGTFTQVGTSTTTSFSVTGLTANTTYRFQVRARDAAGNVSAVSNTAQITTQGGGTSGACSATPTVQTQWATGYVINPLTITNTSTSTINSWTVTFTLPAGHSLSGSWNATVTTSGQNVTVKSVSFNGTLAPGASTGSFGFQVNRPNGDTQMPTAYACTTP
ncbi:polysaccharide deacetylase family protein [Streptosporangiaceae bacterium NEAU-GS5]|nr:polysaccharide deacetylase family protein [Streptosporangiaceae bacterium NEAU-GS5]